MAEICKKNVPTDVNEWGCTGGALSGGRAEGRRDVKRHVLTAHALAGDPDPLTDDG